MPMLCVRRLDSASHKKKLATRKSAYEDLSTAFRHGNFEPLYLLYGEERYFIDSLQKLLLDNALEAHEKDFNLDIVYGAEADVQSVLALCASYPVMAQRRVVLVRDFDKLKDNKRFTAYAEQPNPTAVVFLVCAGKPNINAHPYRAIKKHGIVAEFKALYDNQVPGWIERLAKQRGYTVEPKAVQMLADFIGSNLQIMVKEIEKITTFAGDREVLTAEDVVQASGQTREFNVFELQRAVGEGRHNDAIRITERLLQQSSNPRGESARIVLVLSSFFLKLLKLTGCRKRRIAEKDMAARIGVSPFFIKEYLSCLRRLDVKALNRALASLLAADYELKGGSTRSERLVLTLMLRRMFKQVTVPAPVV